jgi:uncharacterized protein (UPF0548 family)
VAEQCHLPLTYEGEGGTLTGQAPAGYRFEHFERRLGLGEAAFARARTALARWQPHVGSGIEMASDGPMAIGTTVALAAPLPVDYAIAACRIVAVVDEPARYGFAYGTLPRHPESGEELFLVHRRPDDSVTFRISVFSMPHHALARIGSPVARLLQRRATTAYLDAMAEPPPDP